MTRLLLSALLSAGLVSGAHAATAWNEAVSGDLSNNGLAPTAVSFVLGSNTITGTSGRSTAGVIDRDYFNFTIPTGWQLDALTVLPGTTSIGPASISFIAVQAGPQVTVDPTSNSATGLLGYTLYSAENNIGEDILPFIGFGDGATGFLGALPAGTYAFWIQEFNTGTASYNFNFNVSAVPEPTTALLMLAGVAGLAGLRQRRR